MCSFPLTTKLYSEFQLIVQLSDLHFTVLVHSYYVQSVNFGLQNSVIMLLCVSALLDRPVSVSTVRLCPADPNEIHMKILFSFS